MKKHKGPKHPVAESPRLKFGLFLVAGFLLCAWLVWLSVGYAERRLTDETANIARDRLTLYTGTLHAALNRCSYMPHILATHPEVRRLFTAGDNLDMVNRYLEDLNKTSGAMELFILNREGLAVATSNWNTPDSFAGYNYRYRPYYRDAVESGRGKYFGVGSTTGKAGFFFSEKILVDGSLVGVAVTKVDLSLLQKEWAQGGETVFITDAHGVIFLTGENSWRYKAMRPLDDQARNAMLLQRQYGNRLPHPLGVDVIQESGTDVLRLGGQKWLYTTHAVDEYGWTIWFLSPLAALRQQVDTFWYVGISAACVLMLTLLLGRVLFAWRAARRTAMQAEKIQAINRQLAEEIGIRKKAEEDLLAAQGELLHAGRLAALGQMSASVAHELSQPVTSMQMFVASCGKLVREGHSRESVTETLEHVMAMIERIKALIEQLKHFSRKAPGKSTRVSLSDAIANALTVLQFKQEEAACLPKVICDKQAAVQADPMQIEQVLINLLQNALDAVNMLPPGEERRVDLLVQAKGDEVTLSVTDNGPGIEPSVRDTLFTPFVTTKKSGKGIGLGLTIVENIVVSLGGGICLENAPCRGTRFIIHLPAPLKKGSAHE